MTQALELVVRRLEVLVGHQQHGGALTQLDLGDLGALLVEQEGRDLHRYLHVHGGGVLLHRLFLDDAQDLQRGRLGVADVAGAVAARAGDVAAFAERRAQALTAQFEQAELADRAELHARAVGAQRVAQAGLDLAAVLALLHVDEVDDDQAAQVAQPHLARDLVGRLEVGARRGLLDVGAARRARRVHVDRDQRLGVVDHDRAARGQVHRARERGLDLVLDLEAAEQRCVILVALDPRGRFRHHVVHELLGLLVDVVGVDQDLADVGVEVVPDRTDHQRGLLVDQEGALARLGRAVDGAPQLEHVVQVPLQLGGAAPDAGGARDQAHALGVLELVEVLLELLAVLALDAARHAAAARVVGHQHQVAPGQADEGGQRRALVAALLLLDLHQQLGAVGDHVLDLRVADGHAFLEELLGDLLERQEAVAVLAVVDEAGLQRRLDAGDDGLVDVALALFAPLDLGLEVEQFLPVDDRQAPFFRLRGIDQHAFHVHSFVREARGPPAHESDQARRRARPVDARNSVEEPEGIALDSTAHHARQGAAALKRWRVRPRGSGWACHGPGRGVARSFRTRAGRRAATGLRAIGARRGGGGPKTSGTSRGAGGSSPVPGAPPVCHRKTLLVGSYYAGSAAASRRLPLTLGAGPAARRGVASPNTCRRSGCRAHATAK
ncbi:hypothetical protein Y694_04304 [Methylibium sp. T29-B]|nr:hypothetical protein Y694_04304 [Methylibium sp. T29-B]